MCLAVFSEPYLAIRWALASLEHAKLAEWPEALLEHELGEAIELQPAQGANKAFSVQVGRREPHSSLSLLPACY